jgi:F0F1-type ATP synthase membrane subunit b/b'
VLLQTGNLYAQSIREATSKLKENQDKNAQTFKSMIEDQSLTAKFYIQRKIDEELEKAKKEIDEYKEGERKKIDKAIRNVIISLSEDVFEGSLSVDQQEKLIFRALEEAQKKHILEIG